MRLGVFGGTFDPPHLGHLAVASDLHSRLSLDRVIFVPAAVSPFKRETDAAPAELRLEMVRAATAGDARFVVERVELDRPGPSYMVDTLRELLSRLPDAELWLLIGADVARDLSRWRAPGEIVRLARIAVFARDGEANLEELEEIGYPFIPVPVLRLDISATEVRRRVRAGEPIRYLVPDAVREIIEREGLYA
jgi:nicotinate-nucleotide adenylyltransferase